MSPIQKIKDSPHYPKLRQSLEYRHCRKQFLVWLVLCCVIVVPAFLLLCLGEVDSGSGVEAILCLLLAMAIIGFFIQAAYRWLEIFLHIDKYIFREALLDHPEIVHGRYSASVYFTVTFSDSNGKQWTKQTPAMFSSHGEPCWKDYDHRTVLIGYNEETDRLVVIKRLDG